MIISSTDELIKTTFAKVFSFVFSRHSRPLLGWLAVCSLELVTVFVSLGCSASQSEKPNVSLDAATFAAPTELTAALADPINIDLRWKNNATHAAGYFVEYSPNADNEFITIAAVPASEARYRHPNLMPQTRFIFRVLPFFGEASNIAEITTGKKGSQQAPRKGIKTGPSSAPTETRYSVKSASTLAQAAPTDLKATLVPPAGVKLEWKDHAKDEDGYLIEIKSDPNSDFKVSSFLDPGTTSLITYNLPYEAKLSFRVRAFFYGQPSNLAEKTTGREPSDQTTQSLPSNKP